MDIRYWLSILLVSAAITSATSLPVVADHLFEVPHFCNSGENPVSVAVGDIDGDGHSDMAIANLADDTVSIVISNGDGTFQPSEEYVVGEYPQSVILGDLEGDADLDLAVANRNSDSVSVLLGNGDGTFMPAVDYSTGEYPCALVFHDLDGDTALDLAVANYYDSDISVLWGNGDGTFQDAVFHAVAPNPTSVAAGDLNGDSIPDLAVSVGSYMGWGSRVFILLGVGQRDFQIAGNYSGGEYPVDVAMHDLDGDGARDLVVVDSGRSDDYGYYGHFYPGRLIIRRGAGDGTFQESVSYFPDDCPISTGIGDLDGDGIPDLAVASTGRWDLYFDYYHPGFITVYLGQGDGTFESTGEEYMVGDRVYDIAFEKLDNDQHLDMVAINPYMDSGIVFPGNGDGTFKTAAGFEAEHNPMAIAAGDWENDGDLDLVVANYGNIGDDPGCVSIHLNNGDGTFQNDEPLWLGDALGDVALGDVDGDGDLDLAVSKHGYFDPDTWIEYPGCVFIRLNTGEGIHYEPRPYRISDYPGPVAFGDLDGDDALDLIVVDQDDPGAIVVLTGNGDGTFGTAVYYEADGVNSIALGDLDGDDDIDIAASHSSEDVVSIRLGNGNGTLGEAVHYNAGDRPESVAIGDFDGDSNVDLVTGDVTGDTVSVLLGNGDGTFNNAVQYDAGEAPRSVSTGDLNGDEILDLVASNLYSDRISVLLGNGDGTFQVAAQYGAGVRYAPLGVTIGDFNGDMAADIATTNRDVDGVTLFFGIPPNVSTVSADLTCQPSSGLIPFSTSISCAMTNHYSGDRRRIAGRIDIDLAGGHHISNWRSGWANLSPGYMYQNSWQQTISAISQVIGDNIFSLWAMDVTPSPYNQPPYPPAGDTDVSWCTVTGMAPQPLPSAFSRPGS